MKQAYKKRSCFLPFFFWVSKEFLGYLIVRHHPAEVREVCEKSEDGYGGDVLFFSLLLNSPQEPIKDPAIASSSQK